MEIWRDIRGFEGHYQVSNQGNVRSLPRTQVRKNGRNMSHHGKLLKPQPNAAGYLRVKLKKSGKVETWFVHRLVAEHYVCNPKPEEYSIVNHLDNNFLNNDFSNLEWTTQFGNMQHAKKRGRLDRTEEWLANQRKALEKYDRAVEGYDPLSGVLVVTFNSIQEAGRNGYEPSCICFCCKGKRKTHKGLSWKYAS